MSIVAVGCGGGKKGKSQLDLAKEYGPRVQARMDKLVAAAKVAQASGNDLGAPGDPKLTLFNYDAGAGAKMNTVVTSAADLADAKAKGPSELDDRSKVPIFQQSVSDLPVIGKILLRTTSDDSPGYFQENMIQELLAAKYVVVVIVKPENYHPPVADSTSYDFQPGSIDGTAVGVEIETGKPIGGFTFHAASSEQIDIKRNTSTGKSDATAKVLGDMRSQTGKAIAAGIETRWPGSKMLLTYY